MTPSQQTSLQVLDTLDILVRLWNKGDIQGLLSYADKECSGFGATPGAQFRGIDEFRTFLERETLCIKELGLSGIHVDAIGTVSWVTGLFNTSFQDDCTIPEGRFTVVLKGTGHAWVLVHLHFSYPLVIRPGWNQSE